MGFAGRKSGPKQTHRLPEFTLTTERFHADHVYISLGSLRDSLARRTHASQFSAPTLAQPPIPFQIAIDSYKSINIKSDRFTLLELQLHRRPLPSLFLIFSIFSLPLNPWNGGNKIGLRKMDTELCGKAGGGISGFRLDNTIPFISVTSTIPSIGKKPERSDRHAEFEKLNTEILGVSVDNQRTISPPSYLKQTLAILADTQKRAHYDSYLQSKKVFIRKPSTQGLSREECSSSELQIWGKP
ncbi:hypothetical protein LXL04_018258 [Taraxacum kok-saghyz]